jgi:hypothetical protein
MEYRPVRIRDLIRDVNHDLYLPAIQREFVWGPEQVARLFDSVMADFPIGSFLFWKLRAEKKDEWPIYEFIRDFDKEAPHNPGANLAGITSDLRLVLDGQQRITSLFIGLKGSYRYFYYRWKKSALYLNIAKPPVPDEENPEALTYQFAFREDDLPDPGELQHWYRVGRILDFDDAEDAKEDLHGQLFVLSPEQQNNALKLIGKLHNRVHTSLLGNYYEEMSQDYDKVLQVFVRANSEGQRLEYSDLLLATATAKWEKLDAREEIHQFTDALNSTGTGFDFGKDFVLKASLYLTANLPVQYKVKNFTRQNLEKIENNWDTIKSSLATTVRLVSRFGFSAKNIVAPLSLLPIAFFLAKRSDYSFDKSSDADDAAAQTAIRRWLAMVLLKNAFGGSSDTTLSNLRDTLNQHDAGGEYPAEALYKSLGIEGHLNDAEIERFVNYGYQGKYTYLILSLLYPDRDWKDAVFHEDHVFPQSEFTAAKLRKRGFNAEQIGSFLSAYNTLVNLQLLTDSENLAKNATPFDDWIKTRDAAFKKRHLIPSLPDYGFERFGNFVAERRKLIHAALKEL